MTMTDLINRVLQTSYDALSYLQRNAWQIVIILALGYYVKRKVMEQGPRSLHDPRRQEVLREEMRRVRLEQQEKANRAAAAAAEEARQRKFQEKQSPKPKKKEEAVSKKNDTATTTSGYHPLQPLQSHSTGYRPARRTTRRG